MKRWLLAGLLFFLVPGLALGACGDWEEAFGTDAVEQALPEEAREALDGLTATDADLDSGLEKLWAYAREKLNGILKDVLRPAAGVMAVVALCAAADGAAEKRKGFDYVNLCGCLAISAVSVGDVHSLLTLGKETMLSLSDFSKVLLPVLSAASAASGAVTSAPAKYAATMLFLDVLINAANALVFPLVCAYLTAVLADAALDGGLAGPVKLLRWACRFTLGALVTAFTAYLSLTGVVASSADALTTKAAKTALSAALPVVGGIVSDAAGSLVAGAGMIRSAIGVFGLLAVLAVCLVPFLTLGIRYLVFKAAGALAGVVSGGRLARLIDGIGGACGMILSLVGVEAVFLFISILSLIKAVGL